MRRIESITDEMNGVVTYELDDGRYIKLDLYAVRKYGAVKMLKESGFDVGEGKRLPVVWRGREIGTLPGDFDPMFAKSRTFLYDVRPGDFRRDGDRWIADRTLGPGDLDALVGFERTAR